MSVAIGKPDVEHRWSVGDVVGWDSRAVIHRAKPCDTTGLRALWRLSVHLDRD